MRTPRDRLSAERAETAAQVAALAADFAALVAASEDSNADDEHDPEGATIGFERAQLQATLDQARARLAALDDALRRAAGGTYGTCERCGRPIGAERLAALPATRACIDCARAG
jgi:RNA polymerase-binding transcription factor DksA